MIITSRANPTVHTLCEIREGKSDTHIFCEGEKLIEDLLMSPLSIGSLFHTTDTKEKATALLLKARKPQSLLICLAPQVMSYVSDVKTPPGLIATAHRPAQDADPAPPVNKNGLYLLLHDIQLPQNVGALFRTAEASGVEMVWMTQKCGDPFNPKTIRGSTGSVFRVPLRARVTEREAFTYFRKNGIHLVAASQEGKKLYTDYDWTKSCALVMGSEGQGFDTQLLSAMNDTIKIPMQGRVESLNVGTAGAVCLFEAVRQRGKP